MQDYKAPTTGFDFSKMSLQPRTHSDVVATLWAPEEIKRLAHAFADLATAELLNQDGPVRRPDSSRQAAEFLREDTKATDPVALVRRIQEASLHLSHPRFVAQQVAAPIPVAALVESVVAALNQSLAVWEMSPIATAVDRDLMEKFKHLFGFPRGALGSIVPGGGFANLTALLAARDALEPAAATTGRTRIAIIAGEQTHYSVNRAARMLGFGTRAVFRVPLDEKFRTDTGLVDKAFRAARKAGFRKFILVGSAGSTSTGSFDDLIALHRIAERENAWFHVDAAHGGGLIFSTRFRSRLRGISLADSIVFDPHKMMFMPLTAGGVLVRRGTHLKNSLQEQAPYLFGAKRTWPDLGQATIACSQRFDALKVWLLWRVAGAEIWDVLTTHVCEVAEAAHRFCLQSDKLEPMHEPASNIYCFQARGRANNIASDRLHWEWKEELNESGFAYISSTELRGRRVLRLVVMNPRTTSNDVRDVLARIEKQVAEGNNRKASALP